MKQYVNTRRLATGRFFATGTTVAGLVLLILSTILSLNPQLGLASFPILLMGVAMSTIGIQLSHKWTRAPFAHDVLLSALKGLSHDSILLNYWNPVPHLLLTADVIYVLTPFQAEANISVSSEQWIDRSPTVNRLRRVLALESIGSINKLAADNLIKTHSWLDKHFPANNFPLQSCVVFTNPKAHLEVELPPTPRAVYSDKRKPNLKSLVRSQSPTATPIPIEEIASLLQTTR